MNSPGHIRLVVFGALSLLYVLLMAATFNSLGQVLPFMVTDLGMNWAQAGFGFTLLGVGCGLASLIPALLIRTIGVSLTILTGAALLVAGFVALAATHGAPLYHAGTILLGIGFCFCGPIPAVHVISTLFRRRAIALGIYFTVGALGAVIGPILFYLVETRLGGWRMAWTACAGASVVIGGFAVVATRAAGAAAPADEDGSAILDWSIRDALATSQFWIIVAAYTGCLLANTTVHSFAFQNLMERGLDTKAATALVSGAALIAAAGSAAAGFIGERIDGRRLTMLSLFMLSLTAASLVVAQGWFVLGLFAVTFGVGLGFSYVGTAMLMHDYFGKRGSLELYSIMTVVSTSAAIGPGVGGAMRDRFGDFTAAFAALALIDLSLLLIVLVMRRPRPVAATGMLRSGA